MKCSRCESGAITKSRGEFFCADCYTDFINRKIRAHLSFFRVNNDDPESIPIIVIPVNFHASSLALVDLLHKMRQGQIEKHHGMYGFNIKCVYIGEKRAWPWPSIPLEIIPLETFSEPLPNRSAEHDINNILIRKQILKYAKDTKGYTAFGYSMTRISELTLSETVKGRGAAIPSLVSPNLHSDKIVYPLRDIMANELVKYCEMHGLAEHIIPAEELPKVTKFQSIDEIVSCYFKDVQKNFPSVVSTVSKIASRLSQPPEPCGLCQGSDQDELCYACSSALEKSKLDEKNIINKYRL